MGKRVNGLSWPHWSLSRTTLVTPISNRPHTWLASVQIGLLCSNVTDCNKRMARVARSLWQITDHQQGDKLRGDADLKVPRVGFLRPVEQRFSCVGPKCNSAGAKAWTNWTTSNNEGFNQCYHCGVIINYYPWDVTGILVHTVDWP